MNHKMCAFFSVFSIFPQFYTYLHCVTQCYNVTWYMWRCWRAEVASYLLVVNKYVCRKLGKRLLHFTGSHVRTPCHSFHRKTFFSLPFLSLFILRFFFFCALLLDAALLPSHAHVFIVVPFWPIPFYLFHRAPEVVVARGGFELI